MKIHKYQATMTNLSVCCQSKVPACVIVCVLNNDKELNEAQNHFWMH